jgi:O-antigen/teichoic acid export membrane protein
MTTGVEISKRLLLINSASSVIARIISMSVIVWLQQYLLKRISPEEYSLLPVLSSVIVFLPLLTIVFSAGLQRYVTEAYARGDERRVTQIVSTMFPLHLAAGLVLLLAGGVLAWNANYVLNIAPDHLDEARFMMGLMVVSVAVPFVLAPYSVGLYVRQKFMLSSAIGVGQELLRLGLLFVLIFGVSVSVVWVIVASVAANMVGLAVNQVISRRLVPSLKFRMSEIRWEMARELTGFGGWSVVGNLSGMIRMSSIPIILNRLATAVDVNSFFIGFLPYSYVQQACALVERPLMPQLTAMHALGSKERLQSAYLRGGRYVLWLTMAVAAPLMVFHREVILLYVGERYSDAGIVMLLTLAVVPMELAGVMVGNIAIATARIRELSIISLLVQVLNVGLTLYFVAVMGMGAIGPAWAAFLSMGLVWPACTWPLGLRLAEIRWWRWLRESVIPGLLPAAVGVVVFIAVERVAPPATWFSLGVSVVPGLIVYGIVFLFCLQPVDRYDLRRSMAAALQAVGRGKERGESS